ncbi:MAG TPA: hypothetical protein VF452_24335, partial [Candidatus Binatia bacterium]
ESSVRLKSVIFTRHLTFYLFGRSVRNLRRLTKFLYYSMSLSRHDVMRFSQLSFYVLAVQQLL